MTKTKPSDVPMPLEEVARRMLAMPVKPRGEMVAKKKAKQPAKKR